MLNFPIISLNNLVIIETCFVFCVIFSLNIMSLAPSAVVRVRKNCRY